MDYSKMQRQGMIADLLCAGGIASQEELGQRLAAQGHKVTQATISRDLEQMGAVKVRRAGRLSYALPDQPRDSGAPQLDFVLHQWAESIDTAMNMIVIRTPPGSAHLIGVALDKSEIPEKVGTICGDDTIFVACRSVADAENLSARFRSRTSLS